MAGEYEADNAGDGARQNVQFQPDPALDRAAGGGDAGRFAGQIREHMAVIGADGAHVGTVDHIDGDRIKLTRKDSSAGLAGETHEGHHHYLPLALVATVEGDAVRLSANGDVAYGMEQEEGA